MTGREVMASWREERGILRFVDDNFGVDLDLWQEQALLEFEDPSAEKKRLSLQACVGPGKSAVLSWCGWWFLACTGDRGEHPKGLATSITGENLKDNLWAEFSKWQARSPLLSSTFTWTSKRIFANDFPSTWFLGARTWPKTGNADEQGKTFSGLHSEYVLALIDESGAIPSTVLRVAEQALSRCKFGRLLQAGNPIALEGYMLYDAANRLAHQWTVIVITGDPDDPEAWVHSPRVGDEPLQWAVEQIQTYGRENPWVASYILGRFPPAAINALLSVDEVKDAMKRRYRPDVYDWQQKRLGVDVARFGDDRSVIFFRQGLYSAKPYVMRNERTTKIAAACMMAERKMGAELIFVDDTGHWGHGVIDALITAGRPAHPVVFSDKAIDPRYFNRRTEMWFGLADAVKAGLRLPNNLELIPELTTPTFTLDRGKLRLEEKDQIKKRLGRSPDLADALALTFAIPDMPASMFRNRQDGKAETEFNPYADQQQHPRTRPTPRRPDPADLEGMGGSADTDFDPYR